VGFVVKTEMCCHHSVALANIDSFLEKKTTIVEKIDEFHDELTTWIFFCLDKKCPLIPKAMHFELSQSSILDCRIDSHPQSSRCKPSLICTAT